MKNSDAFIICSKYKINFVSHICYYFVLSGFCWIFVSARTLHWWIILLLYVHCLNMPFLVTEMVSNYFYIFLVGIALVIEILFLLILTVITQEPVDKQTLHYQLGPNCSTQLQYNKAYKLKKIKVQAVSVWVFSKSSSVSPSDWSYAPKHVL